MAVTEDIEKQALTAADKAIPDFSVDSNDPRLTQVKSEEDKALAEDEALFGSMIGSTDKLYDQQIQGVKDWESTQIANQQEQTDFAIEKIEQQKGQATEDYKKEQSASYVDWQKQSNQYGANAEKMASAGLTNTGYSESSQVAMYNQYQNRVATAREVYNRAILNYDNAIKDAILQNNAALAQIAFDSLQQQIDLAINKTMYKDSLTLQLSDKKMQTKQFYGDKWRTVYDQISNEKALGWDAQKYYDTQAWNEAQQKEEREFTASENEKDRKWKEEEAEKDRAHDFEMLEKQQRYKSTSGSDSGSQGATPTEWKKAKDIFEGYIKSKGYDQARSLIYQEYPMLGLSYEEAVILTSLYPSTEEENKSWFGNLAEKAAKASGKTTANQYGASFTGSGKLIK